MRKPNTVGGGANTNVNGLAYESLVCLNQYLTNKGFTILDDIVYRDGEKVGQILSKHKLYKYLPKEQSKILSKKLLPDQAILVGDTLYVIEVKNQNGAGSVDEKLQTCDFKKKQYTRLMKPSNIKVEYYYRLNSFFDQPCYDDVFNYIKSVGCRYYFNDIPLEDIGL